ncbi:MAG: DUF111 family protein, partial [Desulfovibrio sp.]
MKTLYLDCSFGVAGDMVLAALADLAAKVDNGPDMDFLAASFRAMNLTSRIEAVSEVRDGKPGRCLIIEEISSQPLRHLPEILDVLMALPLSPKVQARSARAFERLAEVEAAVHEVPVDTIHFHEVGAVDTIIDVAGAFWALDKLGVERVVSTPLPWFTGYVDCSHGRLELPAPATRKLMQGKPTYETDFVGEMITPTGALLIDQLVQEFVDAPG